MTTADWFRLWLGVPAATIAGAMVLAWLFREKLDQLVFSALRRNPGRWVEEAHQVEGFKSLFLAGQLIESQQQEIQRLHSLIGEKLDEVVSLGPQFADLSANVKLLTHETTRLSNAVEKIPDMHTAIELLKQSVKHNTPTGGRRR